MLSLSPLRHLFSVFKEKYQATPIRIDTGSGIELNPELDQAVGSGTKRLYC